MSVKFIFSGANKLIMKKVIFIFAFALMSMAANAQSSVDLNKKWGAIMDAIEQVESRGNTKAVSSNGKWVGCMQISEILVREVNNIIGQKKYTYADRYSREKSREMFIIYQERYNKEGNMEKAIRLWNSGDLKCMQRKASTEGYYRRVMASYNNLARNK